VLAVFDAFPSSVWVLVLSEHGCAFSVSESRVHESTSAAKVAILVGASNELLLGKGDEVTGSDLMGTLHGSSGGEGPAGSAASLVLDWGNSTSGNPVNTIGVGALLEDLELEAVLSEFLLESKHGFDLLVGEVREEVVADSRSGQLLVKLLKSESLSEVDALAQ